MMKNIITLMASLVICAPLLSKDTNKQTSRRVYTYEVQHDLKPKGLAGISQAQIDDHWQLYQGYVKQVNALNQELADLAEAGKADSLAYADRRRRYGFEYNGMVLHELYFGNLKAGKKAPKKGDLHDALAKQFGSFDAWYNDFAQAGKTRGIGWAILYLDPATDQLTNHFIAEHGNGHVAGFQPILVLDVWEHAYMVDHKAGGRGEYIASFMNNIDWPTVEKRYERAREGKTVNR